MIKIDGTYNQAFCYCNEIEETAQKQIKDLCDRVEFSDSKIRIMPDVHAGMGCTIGTTMTLTDKVVPSMVGVDIGCGVDVVKFDPCITNLEEIDTIIHENIPCGMNVREKPYWDKEDFAGIKELRCFEHIDYERALCSIGTLGGGNHFIEIDRDEKGYIYLVIHSGSRHLGNEVAQYYQKQGYNAFLKRNTQRLNELILTLKSEGRHKEISKQLQEYKKQLPTIAEDKAYVEGALFDDYIHDMKIMQRFANLNRHTIFKIIHDTVNWNPAGDAFGTMHNYIDTNLMILRKGAVSAFTGEKLIIPINMKEGSLICVGKGNKDWNYSAPHGAGRLLSRKAAKESLSMNEYKKEMDGVYSSCITFDTIDESPMAYKNIDHIVSNIEETVEIVNRIRPIYNFKATI